MKPQDILRRRPKSILKRPPPLRLPPNSYVVVSQPPTPVILPVQFSPTPNGAFKRPLAPSPHVHFPPYAMVTSTYATHSPGTYDRGAIEVYNNPLEIPARGERVYSPTVGGFVCKTGAGEEWETNELFSPFKQLTFTFSPLPEPSPSLIFAETQRLGEQRSPVELGKALKLYPRSPFPTYPPSKKKSRAAMSPSGLTVQTNSPIASGSTLGPNTSLNHAFWQVVSLDGEQQHDFADKTPSARDSPQVRRARFASHTLWSPGLPRRDRLEEEDEVSLLAIRSPIPRGARMPSIASVLHKFASRDYEKLKD